MESKTTPTWKRQESARGLGNYHANEAWGCILSLWRNHKIYTVPAWFQTIPRVISWVILHEVGLCHIVCCITWRWMPKIIHFMCSMYLLVFTPTENKDGVLKLSVQSTSIFQNCKHSCTFLPLNHLLDDFFPEENDIREIVQICM